MMLSRVAENVYWMSRYLERAENTARMINATTNLLIDLPRGLTLGWKSMLNIMGCSKAFGEHYNVADERNVVRFLIADERNPGSIQTSLSAARENARGLRDQLQRETWEQINDLYLYAKREAGNSLGRRRRYQFMHDIVLRRQAIMGISSSCMSRNDAYRFIVMGRSLERADMTTRIVDSSAIELLSQHTDDYETFSNLRWVNVLRSLSAYQMYRQSVQVRVRGRDVLRYLLQDRAFPRSVAFCLTDLSDCLKALPNNRKPRRSLSRVLREIDGADVEALVDSGLQGFLDEVQVGFNDIHAAIAEIYFRLQEAA
jgi:uncharacterized alpha-E superfamily protein